MEIYTNNLKKMTELELTSELIRINKIAKSDSRHALELYKVLKAEMDIRPNSLKLT